MYLGFNEMSLHGQFEDQQFPELLKTILAYRELAARAGSALRTQRASVLQRPVVGNDTLAQRLQALPAHNSYKRLFLSWLTKDGPFLDDDREHDGGTYFECGGELVTDTVLGECAHRAASRRSPVAAVSAAPSRYAANPLQVWRCDDTSRAQIEVGNYTRSDAFESWLRSADGPVANWTEMLARAKRWCPDLFFAEDVIKPLAREPFNPGVATSFLELLDILQRMKTSFDDSGALTPTGLALREEFFVGGKSWFSDSSDGEKVQWASDLTFPHPERQGEKLFCTWHGKVKTPQMRIHYSDPITARDPLYVVYIGPKITKK